jgi:predicted O-methyltransferase YrrM
MAWADEVGVRALRPGAGGALRLIAAAARAKTVVEIGTGTGCSGVWLLRGMRPDGVLTTIDVEPELQRLARVAFTAAGFPPGRTRLRTIRPRPRCAGRFAPSANPSSGSRPCSTRATACSAR